eukprot:CAMPEP_0202814224 /NCGR_PEP_ID=MMETSP1389-20130828/5394_1 /ASSEMBLY_ACC=CAM_ASM_000865 /TAXON_ID=302021 /ORGANISM="Rhodomonas sp., Strain CCMP768" /LENGTH=62 /DNA_ID=CAMNT_0049485955 /DNA_START=107 /DNA_END=291 /DNA_ORIENTATION=+
MTNHHQSHALSSLTPVLCNALLRLGLLFGRLRLLCWLRRHVARPRRTLRPGRSSRADARVAL